KPWRIDFTSVGPIRINMTVAQVSALLGDSLKPHWEPSCTWSRVSPSNAPAGLSLTIVHDTVVRIDIDSTGIRAVNDLQVGSTTDQIVRAYGDRVERRSSLDGSPYFAVASDDPARTFLLVFRTDGRRISSIVVGRRRAVQVEECY